MLETPSNCYTMSCIDWVYHISHSLKQWMMMVGLRAFLKRVITCDNCLLTVAGKNGQTPNIQM